MNANVSRVGGARELHSSLASSPVDRITVALIHKAANDLQVVQVRTGMSKTDVINRAIPLYEFIDAELAAGSELIIRRDGTDHIVKLL